MNLFFSKSFLGGMAHVKTQKKSNKNDDGFKAP